MPTTASTSTVTSSVTKSAREHRPDPQLQDRIAHGDDRPWLVIEPSHGWIGFNFSELWHYRDLLWVLTWREISVRYKQTVLGFTWAIIQPFMMMVVFTVFLGNLAKVPSDGIPYPIFSYLGLLPWTFFSAALTRSSGSLVAHANLLNKVYFPRLLIPLSGTLSAVVDFLIAFLVLIGLMAWYGYWPAPSSVLLVPLVVLTAMAANGAGMWLAALNVRYRDIQHAIPFLIQLWMYATPIVYPASIVPARWRFVFAINPLTGIIEAYRAATLGRPVNWASLGISTAAVLIVTAVGAWRFRATERVFADIA